MNAKHRRREWRRRSRNSNRGRFRYERRCDPDCVTQMELFRRRPDALMEALLEMGVSADGDGLPSDHD